MKRILLTNIEQLVQIREKPIKWVAGKEMQDLPTLQNAYLLMEGEKVLDLGEMKGLNEQHADEAVDCTGKLVLPCWCDSHTHIVYAKSRAGEFVDRIKGLSYEEIAARGGGILNSARMMQEADEDALFESALERVEEVVKQGTGALEIKSGYGLTLEAEKKMLRVARRLKEETNVTIKTTFLGAHAFPLAYRDNRDAYVDLVVNDMMPEIAGEGLADYCDVFCEEGFFTPEQANRVLEAGIKHGLKPKVHAHQLHFSGGIEVGVKNNAISVDHLECVGDTEIELLRNSNTISTLLPSATFFLNLGYAPARKMIDAGLPIALATDFNPGSTPTGNIPFILSLACIKMRMLPEEAINAATINGAYAMEVGEELGSIRKGGKANIFITPKMESVAEIPYYFGSPCVERVMLNGKWQ